MSFFALAMRNLTLRKWRTAMLLVGYGLGVATMIVLLSIGEALVLQASDEKLVGGGEITVLPQGIDVEVMKTGGLGGMFFSIDHSRFVHRQLLGGPRARGEVASAAPQMTGKLLYVGTRARTIPVLASGEIPSLSRAVNAMPRVASGVWDDDESDRRWTAPTPFELRHEIDRFHLPPPDARGDSTWGEWHYFNVLWPGGRKWAFVSLIIGGAVPDARWGGQVLVTLHEIGRPPRRFVSYASPDAISLSTSSANLRIGTSSVTVLPNGDYRVVVAAADEATGAPLGMDVVVAPSPGAYFPGAAIGGTALVSGYVVPALRASASGRFCVSGRCDELSGVQSYHDHNWGIWRDVAWEWGEARAGDYTVLYGRIMSEGVADQPLFLYLVDSLGFVALFRPKEIAYVDGGTASVSGRRIRVPTRAVMRDARGDDSIVLELDIEDAAATDVRKGTSQKIGRISRTWFVQMKGIARLQGRINGRAIAGAGQGFFETYR